MRVAGVQEQTDKPSHDLSACPPYAVTSGLNSLHFYAVFTEGDMRFLCQLKYMHQFKYFSLLRNLTYILPFRMYCGVYTHCEGVTFEAAAVAR
jgi:hypothetical protein